MTEHSLIPPSSIFRIIKCPGSLALENKIPIPPQSESAKEGELAHLLAKRMISGSYKIYSIEEDGEVTEEMIRGSKLYNEYALSFISQGAILHIEEKLDISVIDPECWGTPDLWFVNGNTLHVFDYKFGHGYVEVFENWQLLAYAAGALELHPEVTDIALHIIQPRCYGYASTRVWKLDRKIFNEKYLRQMQIWVGMAISEMREPQENEMFPSLRPGSQCTFCRARAHCPELKKQCGIIADVSKENTLDNLTPHETGTELRFLLQIKEVLEARVTGLSEQALHLLKEGTTVSYFKNEPIVGREKWKISTSAVISLGEMMGLDLTKPREVVTPKQAIALGISDEIVRKNSEIKVSGYKLKLDNYEKLIDAMVNIK